MAYVNYKTATEHPVEGYILQAAVSDREASTMDPESLEKSIECAVEMISQGLQDECMPKSQVDQMTIHPITAYRWQSLAAKGQVTYHAGC
jgi:hypothetical protein